jgi:hypothetical protein
MAETNAHIEAAKRPLTQDSDTEEASLSVSTYGTTYESCGTEPNSFSLSPYSSYNLHSISV